MSNNNMYMDNYRNWQSAFSLSDEMIDFENRMTNRITNLSAPESSIVERELTESSSKELSTQQIENDMNEIFEDSRIKVTEDKLHLGSDDYTRSNPVPVTQVPQIHPEVKQSNNYFGYMVLLIVTIIVAYVVYRWTKKQYQVIPVLNQVPTKNDVSKTVRHVTFDKIVTKKGLNHFKKGTIQENLVDTHSVRNHPSNGDRGLDINKRLDRIMNFSKKLSI